VEGPGVPDFGPDRRGLRELIYAIKDHLAALKAEEAAAWPSPTSAWTTACNVERGDGSEA
jgi:hypothetical protein